jgi:hypothetical protein
MTNIKALQGDTIFFVAPKQEDPTIIKFNVGHWRYILVKDERKIRNHIRKLEHYSLFHPEGCELTNNAYAMGSIVSPKTMEQFIEAQGMRLEGLSIEDIQQATIGWALKNPRNTDFNTLKLPDELPLQEQMFLASLAYGIGFCCERTSIQTAIHRARGEKVKLKLYNERELIHVFPQLLYGGSWVNIDTGTQELEMLVETARRNLIKQGVMQMPIILTNKTKPMDCLELQLEQVMNEAIPAHEV